MYTLIKEYEYNHTYTFLIGNIIMQKLNGNNLVAQGNKMIQGRYSLTLNEKLLLQAMVSLINPKDQEFKDFCVTLDELCKILNVDRKSATREFKKTSNKLLKRIIEIEHANGGWEGFQWVSHASVEEGSVRLRFHDKLKPYLLDLKESGGFTQYRLWNVSGFRSNYSIRIYQILKEHYGKKIYTFEFATNDFKKMILGRDVESYKQFKFFRVRVINTAQKELSEKDKATGLYKSDLGFDLETKRIGRKIARLIFTIKTQQTKPIETPQAEQNHTTNDSNTSQIIRDYETFGVMRKMVQPYLNQRGEQALQNTLNKFYDDKQNGKITKSEQGYLAYLLRVNAGQETTQEKSASKPSRINNY
jgi:plasmid replication initiation protein